ncbi:MFS transporter [Pigmentiphaga litoralis]|uniref:MFS family permease n=1 Tax=Pigmentiphaga litoralis TaxID=516702 RepID=A0A7Y9LMK5_9BURK|nr:MFS transporter [Pigmentiphaga litoralis]NYE24605.1 MFS family permease [Pigmentiphaga litoralis]NYE81781.1 MFS family permease [Pigmentiphaga litoralis]
MMRIRRYPLALIVVAQLCGTSLWFSPNSAAESLASAWNLSGAQLGQLTGSTQMGFIAGTLLLAASGAADRYSATRLFTSACLVGAMLNAAFALLATNFQQGMVIRFAVGVCLAGIYPLGMKMVIGWTRERTGAALGLLVGMLTLGSALPHAVRAAGGGLSWEAVVLTSSLLAIGGACLVRVLGDGPYLPPATAKKGQWGAALTAFKGAKFRAIAMGYFGHMWELYAFWTLVPFFVKDLVSVADVDTDKTAIWVAVLSFAIIGVGALGSSLGGWLSKRVDSAAVAATALAISGLMCLVYPLVRPLGLAFCVPALLLWGLTVIMDSAQFSALSANACPPELVGGALAIQNSIGFLITVASITWVTRDFADMGVYVAWYLLPGPLLGLLFFMPIVLRARRGRLVT